MAKEGNQHLATYYYVGRIVSVYGCYDSDTPDGTFDFYDVHDNKTGACLNEGDPYDEFPTWWDVRELLDEIPA